MLGHQKSNSVRVIKAEQFLLYGMIIEVRVTPNSKLDKIEEKEDKLFIKIKAKAVNGKANKALIEKLADYFHRRKSQVKIIKGLRSHNKIVEINDE